MPAAPLTRDQIASLGPADETPPTGVNRLNAHPRDALLSFYPESHTYLARGAVPLESVSSVIARQFPVFDRDGVASRIARRDGRPVQEILDEWDCKGSLARAAGTFMHLQIERRLLGLESETEFEHSFEGPTLERRERIDVAKELAFFEAWRAEERFVPYRTEWRIFDEEHALAGTVDFIARREDGEFVMYDWKRSNKLVARDPVTGKVAPVRDNPFRRGLGRFGYLADTPFHHYLIQQNLYREILYRHYGIRLGAMYLVVLSSRYDRAWQLPVPYDPRIADILLA